MAIFYKEDVVRNWLAPMADVVQVVGKVYRRFSEDLMITSGTEGTHSINSLHYLGHAVDFRAGSRSKGDIMSALRNAGYKEIDFDLIDGYATRHYHLEYDPKSGNVRRRQEQLYRAYLNRKHDLQNYLNLLEEWKEYFVK